MGKSSTRSAPNDIAAVEKREVIARDNTSISQSFGPRSPPSGGGARAFTCGQRIPMGRGSFAYDTVPPTISSLQVVASKLKRAQLDPTNDGLFKQTDACTC